MIHLLESLDPILSDRPVPHCPDWTVAMTVSHMVGVPESIMSGDMADVTSDEWTARQVERHRGRTLSDLARIWRGQSEKFDILCTEIPQPIVSQFVFDQVTHEHDIRWALAMPGDRTSAAVSTGAAWLRHVAGTRVEIPADLADFDVLRNLSGRRSLSEVVAAGFDGASVEGLLEAMPLKMPPDRVGD